MGARTSRRGGLLTGIRSARKSCAFRRASCLRIRTSKLWRRGRCGHHANASDDHHRGNPPREPVLCAPQGMLASEARARASHILAERSKAGVEVDVEIESKSDEIKRLERCINDLVSVLALPAIWTGHESSLVASTLLDVLVRILRLDVAYVRAIDFVDELAREWIRSANGSYRDAQAHEIGRVLEPYLVENPPRGPQHIANPFAEGTASIMVFHLGLQESVGVFVAGSRRPEFPTETERLLLQVAMNQAAIAFQEARYVSQRRRTTEDLERRVVERTAELTAVNEALRQEIVERARTEEELQQIEAHFQLAIDTIPGLVWGALPDGHIDYFNQRWREYTGLTLREAGGWGWQEGIPLPRLAGRLGSWRQLLLSGGAGEMETPLRIVVGRVRWFSLL